MSKTWVDYVDPVYCENLKATWRQLPNQKTFCLTITLPYSNNDGNVDLYQKVITHMKWLRNVFKNPSCYEQGYIIKRSRVHANALDVWSSNKQELEGTLDIIRQIVSFRQYKTFDPSDSKTQYSHHASAAYNGANYITKMEDGESWLFKLNSALDVKNLIYPERINEKVSFVACGDPANVRASVNILLQANARILEGMNEIKSLNEALHEAVVWKANQKEECCVVHLPTPSPPKQRLQSFTDVVQVETDLPSTEEDTHAYAPTEPTKVADGAVRILTRAHSMRPPPGGPFDVTLTMLPPQISINSAPMGASVPATEATIPHEHPHLVPWEAFMRAMADQKMHFDLRLARLEHAINGQQYTIHRLVMQAQQNAQATNANVTLPPVEKVEKTDNLF
jgi:hypothetical protein